MKKLLSAFILAITLGGATFVNATPTITSLDIFQNHTYDGGTYIPPTGTLTLFPHITFTRALTSGGTYENVNIQVHLVYTNISGVESELMPTRTITSADFNNEGVLYKSYIASIPGGSGSVGGTIRLKIYYTDPNTGVLEGPVYSTTFRNTNDNVGNVQYSNHGEGGLSRNTLDGKIYVKLAGVLRHIQTVQTLKGVWRSQVTISDGYGAPNPTVVREPITPNTGFIRHTATQKIYFIDGNIIRYIPSTEVKESYQFTFDYIQNRSSLAGLVEEPEIQLSPKF